MTEPPPMTERILTADEVAAEIEFTPRSVRRWAEAGDFPGAMCIHGRWRFPESVVEDYKQRHQR